jgi:hypothetical protein
MGNEYVIEKLISSLSHLSDRELHDLANLFYQRHVAEAFAQIVEKTVYLREAERHKRMPGAPYEIRIVERREGRGPVRRSEPARERFFAILNDRDLFPSTRDVVEVLNDVFELGFRYEDYRKRGRKDLIEKCWRHFEGMPLTERRNVLSVLSRRSTDDPFRSEGYHELFRILSQK